MPQRRRTQAAIDAERRYKAKHKRVHLVFNTDNPTDAKSLEWLRSQVSTDADIPALIKAILEKQQ
jgi:hypothetical protein